MGWYVLEVLSLIGLTGIYCVTLGMAAIGAGMPALLLLMLIDPKGVPPEHPHG